MSLSRLLLFVPLIARVRLKTERRRIGRRLRNDLPERIVGAQRSRRAISLAGIAQRIKQPRGSDAVRLLGDARSVDRSSVKQHIAARTITVGEELRNEAAVVFFADPKPQAVVLKRAVGQRGVINLADAVFFVIREGLRKRSIDF